MEKKDERWNGDPFLELGFKGGAKKEENGFASFFFFLTQLNSTQLQSRADQWEKSVLVFVVHYIIFYFFFSFTIPMLTLRISSEFSRNVRKLKILSESSSESATKSDWMSFFMSNKIDGYNNGSFRARLFFTIVYFLF